MNDYGIGDIVKKDLMWDVESIYSKPVQCETLFTDGEANIMGIMITGERAGTSDCKAFAYLGYPNSTMPKGGFPAVLLLHGGGGRAFKDWVSHWNSLGFAALALDLSGRMADENGEIFTNPDYIVRGANGFAFFGANEEAFKTSWTYHNIAFSMHANNLLRTDARINKDKIGVTGVSWGGFLTCILSGVDKRFAAFASVYGAGNLANDSWGLQDNRLGLLTEEQRAEWTSVYDPIVYLPYAVKPMLFLSGVDDPAFSAWNRKISSSLVPGKTFFSYKNTMQHGHYWHLMSPVEYFMEHILIGREMMPYIVNEELSDDGQELILTMGETNPQTVAELNYSLSREKDTHLWKWKSRNITITSGENRISLPEDYSAVYVRFFGDAAMSTDIYFEPKLNELM